jgi:hypothetical protein
VLEFIKAKSDGKNCLVRKNRKREDSDGFIKEIPPLQTRRRSGRKGQNQTIHNSMDLSGEGNSLLLLPKMLQVRLSGKGGGGFIRIGQG